LLVGDGIGYFRLISSRDGELIKDFGKINQGEISGILKT
jgi:hypothetical protein